MRTPADGLIEWAQSSIQIGNLVRALVAPWPGAFTWIGDTKLVLRHVTPIDAVGGAQPGTVIRLTPGQFQVACATGAVEVTAMEVDGRAATVADLHRLGVAEGQLLSR